MQKYIIFTDSGCDIPEEELKSKDIRLCDLTFSFTEEGQIYCNREMKTDEFYRRMRSGQIAKTSAVNVDHFTAMFSEALQKGCDVLYIGISSAISGTYQSARIAARELNERYPNRQIITVDSLCACAGLGLLVHLAYEKKRDGASLAEAAAFAEEIKGCLCHWFTVDDLVYLKRGGRVNAAAAAVGQLLNIKPILHVDDGGYLKPVSKSRGRSRTIITLAEKYDELGCGKNAPIYIGHSDCYSDALLLANLIHHRHSAADVHIYPIGPVIGAHSGPGTLALFFLGERR